ncbi:hypothetical protein L596_008554 [Steinernema carpocapsae]|uniref:Uncharacterized protein n=1 Tax=Steinernema carpocapsae TaxID=34508 RepID=A0A4U5PCX8_STECR|nr:hypothetical protein L596_008554 [Steinernema carpocapsae]
MKKKKRTAKNECKKRAKRKSSEVDRRMRQKGKNWRLARSDWRPSDDKRRGIAVAKRKTRKKRGGKVMGGLETAFRCRLQTSPNGSGLKKHELT